jgi:YHS domain-containing protein
MIAGIIKFIFFTLIAYVFYLILRFFSALNQGMKSSSPKQRLSGKMVKDETCNTYLPREDAIKEIFQGKEYYFCSETCRKKFLQSKRTS